MNNLKYDVHKCVPESVFTYVSVENKNGTFHPSAQIWNIKEDMFEVTVTDKSISIRKSKTLQGAIRIARTILRQQVKESRIRKRKK